MSNENMYSRLGTRPEAVLRIPELHQRFGQVRETLFPNSSKSERLLELAAELTPLTAEGFMRDVSDPQAYHVMFNDVANHIGRCDRLIIYRDSRSGSPSAYLAVSRELFHLSFQYRRLYHLEGMIVAERMHGTGFSRAILARDLFECQADILAFHTQSKKMLELGRQLADESPYLGFLVGPDIGTQHVAKVFGYGYMDKGRYGNGSLYGDRDRFTPIAVRETGFDAFAGDALIFAGYVTPRGRI